jgi:TRAP-type C4-dicarboxylate transport system permease small subunit
MLVRALRKTLLEALALGAFAALCLIAWLWSEGASFRTIVLLTLALSAVGVTLFVLAVFAAMPSQYLRHRRALREEIRTRGALSDEEREDARVRRRIDGEPSADRDPRVVPWWEW